MGVIAEVKTRLIDRFLAVTGLYSRIYIYRPRSDENCTPKLCPEQTVLPVKISVPETLSLTAQAEIENLLTSGLFSFFGRERSIKQYQKEYQSSQPSRPWWKIDSRDYDGDPRMSWELDRHQFLPLLGWAACYPQYEAAAQEWIHDYLGKWFVDNPPEKGLCWASNLEVALRAVSWCLLYWLCRPVNVQEPFWRRFRDVLYHHSVHLAKRLSHTEVCMPNNHLLGEVCALLVLAVLFGNEDWKKYRRWLARLAEEQFYTDGVNIEQSLHYHAFSLQLLLLAAFILKKIGEPFEKRTEERIRQAVCFLQWTVKPDGSWPKIGDSDDGKAFCLFESHKSVMDKAVTMAGCYIQDIVGEKGLFQNFAQGGFGVWRSGWTPEDSYLLVKYGPHRFHAHADLLHLEYSFGGENILIDPGTYRYNNAPALRRYFRGTAAHNTIMVDNQDQSTQFKTFRWLNCAKVRDVFCQQADALPGEIFHADLRYAQSKIRHRRSVTASRELYEFIVLDSITGAGAEAVAHFHFDPSLTVKIDGEKELVIIQTKKGKRLTVRFESPSLVEIELLEGPYSARYGELTAHQFLRVALNGKGEELCLKTHIKTSQIN